MDPPPPTSPNGGGGGGTFIDNFSMPNVMMRWMNGMNSNVKNYVKPDESPPHLDGNIPHLNGNGMILAREAPNMGFQELHPQRSESKESNESDQYELQHQMQMQLQLQSQQQPQQASQPESSSPTFNKLASQPQPTSSAAYGDLDMVHYTVTPFTTSNFEHSFKEEGKFVEGNAENISYVSGSQGNAIEKETLEAGGAVKQVEPPKELIEKWKNHVAQWRKKVMKSPSTEEINRLAAHLKTDFDSMESVNSIKLTEFDLGDIGAMILATAMGSNKSITQLDLGFNSIGAKGITSIASLLQDNNTLRDLCLSGNTVLPQGSRALGEALSNGISNLQTLYLAGCGIGTEGIKYIAASFEGQQGGAGCRSLRNLHLGSNKIGCNGVSVLARALLRLHDLGVCKASSFQLFLSENNISGPGAECLAVVLEKTGVLGYLELSINRIGSDGATALSSGLACNKSLHYLQLEHNNIGNIGAAALATAIRHNTALRCLDIQSCEIGEHGLMFIARALYSNRSLVELYCGQNKFQSLEEGVGHASRRQYNQSPVLACAKIIIHALLTNAVLPLRCFSGLELVESFKVLAPHFGIRINKLLKTNQDVLNVIHAHRVPASKQGSSPTLIVTGTTSSPAAPTTSSVIQTDVEMRTATSTNLYPVQSQEGVEGDNACAHEAVANEQIQQQRTSQLQQWKRAHWLSSRSQSDGAVETKLESQQLDSQQQEQENSSHSHGHSHGQGWHHQAPQPALGAEVEVEGTPYGVVMTPSQVEGLPSGHHTHHCNHHDNQYINHTRAEEQAHNDANTAMNNGNDTFNSAASSTYTAGIFFKFFTISQ